MQVMWQLVPYTGFWTAGGSYRMVVCITSLIQRRCMSYIQWLSLTCRLPLVLAPVMSSPGLVRPQMVGLHAKRNNRYMLGSGWGHMQASFWMSSSQLVMATGPSGRCSACCIMQDSATGSAQQMCGKGLSSVSHTSIRCHRRCKSSAYTPSMAVFSAD